MRGGAAKYTFLLVTPPPPSCMMCRVRQTGNPLAGYHVDSPTDVIQHYWNRFLVLGEEEDEEKTS